MRNVYRKSGKKAKDRYLKLNRLSQNSNRRVRFRGYIYPGRAFQDLQNAYIILFLWSLGNEKMVFHLGPFRCVEYSCVRFFLSLCTKKTFDTGIVEN